MRKLDEKKLLRVLDANFNRAKEGLRVCEDVCRFVIGNKRFTEVYKGLRHRLTQNLEALKIKTLILNREIETDVGRATTAAESKRAEVADIFYANSQRVKESVRVLEEFTKLLNVKIAGKLKNIRYQIYAIEKKIIASL